MATYHVTIGEWSVYTAADSAVEAAAIAAEARVAALRAEEASLPYGSMYYLAEVRDIATGERLCVPGYILGDVPPCGIVHHWEYRGDQVRECIHCQQLEISYKRGNSQIVHYIRPKIENLP